MHTRTVRIWWPSAEPVRPCTGWPSRQTSASHWLFQRRCTCCPAHAVGTATSTRNQCVLQAGPWTRDEVKYCRGPPQAAPAGYQGHADAGTRGKVTADGLGVWHTSIDGPVRQGHGRRQAIVHARQVDVREVHGGQELRQDSETMRPAAPARGGGRGWHLLDALVRDAAVLQDLRGRRGRH